ncbi:MAG: hypothetical protein ABIA97_06970 [Candidatus Omnitrophota bacterium]
MKSISEQIKEKYINIDPASRVFLISLTVSIISYLLFLAFRGFGWDGDSFVSASQFVRLINPKIYGIPDAGTHPKLFTILLFGSIYKLFNGFYVLTFISILLNSLMIAYLSRWIYDLKGYWQIAVIGIIVNVYWSRMVIDCDNPAFNIPFVLVGLYYYFHKHNKSFGAILILIAGLFRPNADLVLIFLIFWEIKNKNKIAWFLLFILFVSSIHTLFGYRLAYPTKELFDRLCHFQIPNYQQEVIKYRFSIKALNPHIASILKFLFSPLMIVFLIPSLLGFLEVLKQRKSILFILLLGVLTSLFPIGTFIYGVTVFSLKFAEYIFVIVAFSSFIPLTKLTKTLNLNARASKAIIVSVFVCAFVLIAIRGKNSGGKYQTNPVDGSGSSGWRQELVVKEIIKQNYPPHKYYSALIWDNLTFFILDNGYQAKEVLHVKDSQRLLDLAYTNYDLILFPRKYFPTDIRGYKRFNVDRNRVLFLKKLL